MKKLSIFLLGVFSAFVLTINAHADDHFAVSAQASTLGLGAQATVKIVDELNFRLGGNGFAYNYHGTEDGIDYNVRLRMASFPVLLDWVPFKEGLRLTGGLVINENHVDADARPSATYTIGNTTYTAAQAGTLTGKVYFHKLAPYAGIGWGNPFAGSSSWSIGIDLGVMFQGTPKTKLKADGLLANDPTFQANLARQKSNLDSDLKRYKYYPVVAVALTYRF